MAKKIQLNIAEPCHENWDAMMPDAKGKFCSSCQKQVVDFSSMSDRQIAEFFKKPSTGSVCGRFMSDQLDRPIDIPKKRIPWFKYFFQIALPAFVLSLKASANKTQGQVRVKTEQTDTTRKPDIHIRMGLVAKPILKEKPQNDTVVVPVKDPELFIKGEIDVVRPVKDTLKEPQCEPIFMGAVAIVENNKKEIEGIVINSNGEYVPFASIQMSNGKTIMADDKGNFSIKRNSISKQTELTISSVSYETKKMIVSRNYYGKLVVQLKENNTLPKVVIAPMTVLGGITRSYTVGGVGATMLPDTVSMIMDDKSEKSTIPSKKENGLIVYPNPAVAGASINISLKNPDEGYYQLQLLDLSGKVIRQQEVWIDAEAKLMNTEVPIIAAGTYVMVLTNRKNGKKYSEMIIIH